MSHKQSQIVLWSQFIAKLEISARATNSLRVTESSQFPGYHGTASAKWCFMAIYTSCSLSPGVLPVFPSSRAAAGVVTTQVTGR
jgi:hypothetical protein